MKIKISLNEDTTITICGNIDLFYANRRLNRFIKNFEPIFNENSITIEKRFINKIDLYEFKKSIQKKISSEVTIDYNSFYNKHIQEYKIIEENFLKFSNEAKNIWHNKFNKNDFKTFCDIIKNRMSRRLYSLQLRSAYHMAFSQNTCNFSVPGSGKTTIVYGAYAYLSSLNKNSPKYVNKIFVIGPSSSFNPWETEYKKNFGILL